MLRKLFFSLIYYWKPVWDTGISPPELLSFIETHPPGRALELGCGSGTNAITLARSSWEVTGVDFSRRAIQIAKKKAKRANVRVNFRLGDVTRLEDLEGKFDLILDIGCFHSLQPAQQAKYIQNILGWLTRNGTYLLYAFFKSTDLEFGPGITEEHLHQLQENLKLVSRRDGTDRGIRPSAWLEFKRNHQ